MKKMGKHKPWHWPFNRIAFSGHKEFECKHGIGHGLGIHGCDGCCKDKNFPFNKQKIKLNTNIRHNSICKCGHTYAYHTMDGYNFAECWANNPVYSGVICECYQFELNNLSYLESKYDEQRTK